jgi:4-amino-4-deoxy-L-arabinose transferase-like glycosyltransferase
MGWLGLIGAIAVLASLAIVQATQWGAGLSPDSVTYLGMAKLFERGLGIIDIGNGRGLATSHYPPMYPLVLSALNVDGIQLRETARWLNVVLAGVNVMLVAALAWRATGQRGPAVAAAALAACSIALLDLHAWVWTEPMFLAFMSSALLLMGSAIARPDSRALLIAAALATAAAALTRYAGISLIAATTLGVILLRRGVLRQRIVDGLVFGLIAGLPLGLWMARNAWFFSSASNREVRLLGFDQHDLDHLARTFNVWTLPLQRMTDLNRAVIYVVVLLLALALLGAAGAGYLHRRRAAVRRPLRGDSDAAAIALRRLLALLAVCYFGLVALTICFLDSSTPFDTRILSPIHIAAMVGATEIGARIAAAGRLGMTVVCALLAIVLAAQVQATRAWAIGAHDRGLGFAMRRWVQSPALGHVSRLPEDTRIYSNAPELVEAHLDRNALILPRPFNVSTRSRTDYEQTMSELAESLREHGGVVVWFNRVPRNVQYESPKEIIRKLNLVRIARSKDGALYEAIGAATRPATRPAAPPVPMRAEQLPGED